MRDRDRLWATVVIWSAVTVIILGIVAAITLTGPDVAAAGLLISAVVVVMLFLLGAAGFSTGRVWGSASQGQQEQGRAVEARKEKRAVTNRVARLVDDLDDDELIELETLLMARDEDVVR
ncbi:MAG: hypothetical protein JW910_00215 [Anaerolineae bacterium]|nr:hypothetical protein [Anaerolineae bacterium]